MSRFISAIVVTLLWAGVAIAQAEAPAEPLPGGQVKEILVGNSLTGDTSDGPYTFYFPAYGEIRGLRSNRYRDNGVWRVTEDKVCGRWENWHGNVERCWHVYRDGDSVSWMRPDGSGMEQLELVEGNPNKL